MVKHLRSLQKCTRCTALFLYILGEKITNIIYNYVDDLRLRFHRPFVFIKSPMCFNQLFRCLSIFLSFTSTGSIFIFITRRAFLQFNVFFPGNFQLLQSVPVWRLPTLSCQLTKAIQLCPFLQPSVVFYFCASFLPFFSKLILPKRYQLLPTVFLRSELFSYLLYLQLLKLHRNGTYRETSKLGSPTSDILQFGQRCTIAVCLAQM